MDAQEWYAARAMLEWQVELGATECIVDTPINRYNMPVKPAVATPQPAPHLTLQAPIDPVAEAEKAAASATNLAQLRDVMAAYPHCELQKGARNFVFSDGVEGAPVMIIGEAPGRDEDMQGKPFVGRAGQLLDKMLAAIDWGRDKNVYITNILPYRPPQNRDPKPDEVAMMMPFLRRHVALG
ncbi:MAG: uracil-DNA glycosylase, partial [Pseudomonadota bacterium]